jgi:hypothetical protein
MNTATKMNTVDLKESRNTELITCYYINTPEGICAVYALIYVLQEFKTLPARRHFIPVDRFVYPDPNLIQDRHVIFIGVDATIVELQWILQALPASFTYITTKKDVVNAFLYDEHWARPQSLSMAAMADRKIAPLYYRDAYQRRLVCGVWDWLYVRDMNLPKQIVAVGAPERYPGLYKKIKATNALASLDAFIRFGFGLDR